MIETREALDDLKGTVCRGCDGKKSPMKSHCRRCYFALPKPLQRRLYQLIGHGYEAAYTESVELLRQRRK